MYFITTISFILLVTVASNSKLFHIDLSKGTEFTEEVANTIFGNIGPVKHFETRNRAEINTADGCKVIRVYLPVVKNHNHIGGVSFENRSGIAGK